MYGVFTVFFTVYQKVQQSGSCECRYSTCNMKENLFFTGGTGMETNKRPKNLNFAEAA